MLSLRLRTHRPHTNIHMRAFGLKNTRWKTESREKEIFSKAGGEQGEGNEESEAKKEDDRERSREAVGGENRGAGKEAKIGGNKEAEGAKQTETDGWSKEREW